MQLGTEIRFQDRRFQMPRERIVASERWGYDAVFGAGDGVGSDALASLAHIAAFTERIKLGTCIAKIIARTPASMAMAFQTIDQLAGGNRTIIGLGSSDQRYARSWHVHPWGNPVQRMRDYVAIMRLVASGQPVEYHGSTMSIPSAEGDEDPGPPVAALLETNPDIPILIGAFGPQMITLAAEIAEGWMPTGFRPGMLKAKFAPLLEEGFRRAGDGKGYGDFQIWVHIDINVDDDVRAAMLPFKRYVCTYSEYQLPLMAEAGFGDAAARIQDELDDRLGKGAAAGYHRPSDAPAADDPILDLVPDEFIDGGWLCGPIQRFEKLLEPWLTSGATGFIIRYGPQVGDGSTGVHYENLEGFRAIARLLDKPGSD